MDSLWNHRESARDESQTTKCDKLRQFKMCERKGEERSKHIGNNVFGSIVKIVCGSL